MPRIAAALVRLPGDRIQYSENVLASHVDQRA
jgi:hypothetical protein